jgi:hypothetical protein
VESETEKLEIQMRTSLRKSLSYASVARKQLRDSFDSDSNATGPPNFLAAHRDLEGSSRERNILAFAF